MAACALLVLVTVGVGAILAVNARTISPVLGGTLLALNWIPCLAAWAYAPRGFAVRDDEIVILRRWAAPVVLPASSIRHVAPLRDVDARSIRTFGVGGLFGHYGHYRSATLGDFKMYATRSSGRVLVATTTGNYVLTPEPPEQFVRRAELLISVRR